MKCPCCGQEVKETEKGIDFNFDTHKFIGIDDTHIKEWKEAYPAIDIITELKKMAQWLLSNPTKKKKNYRKFITNWLGIAQQRGGDRKYEASKVPTPPRIDVASLPVSKFSEKELQEKREKIQELIKKTPIGKDIA
jgi:hypothetical protein